MKIALIFLPIRLEKNWSALKAQDEQIGVMPPLSLTYVGAIAENAGHKVCIIDAVAERLGFEEVINRIREFNPDLLGYTITTYGLHQNLEGIKKIRRHLAIPVILGGWHLSLYPHETMVHPEIDYAVIGEADLALPKLLRELENGGDLSAIDGIAFRKDGEIIVNYPKTALSNIDETPFPARHLLKNDKYHNILTQRKNFTVMLSARGCPFRCIFCDLKSIKFRQRSPKNFVDEIEQCQKVLNINEIDIYDSSFTVNKKRVLAICDEINKRKIDIAWTVRTRADCVDKEMLLKLKGAGCTTLMYGIESGSQEILKRLRKDTNLEHIKEVVKFTKKCGMKALGFFIIGSPGDTPQTIKQTMSFMRELDLDYIQVTKMTPFPNTEVYETYVKESGIDYWREFTKDRSFERELPLIGTEITQKQALKYVKQAYVNFYYNPLYIIKALRRIKTPFELWNSVKAAFGILTSKQHLE